MEIFQTEKTHASAKGFDLRDPYEALDILATSQVAAAWSVRSALHSIAAASGVMAESIAAGGRLAYAAAGSSAFMAMADALELPATYGIPRERIKLLIAGGIEALLEGRGAPEDDAGQGQRDVAAAGIGPGDCLIAISASGTTPYAIGAIEAARRAGATSIGLANNPGTAVLTHADLAICLPTPAEVIAGSTRMGAGTAQKIALNMLSTMLATRLGHVHDGYMINLTADNLKLKARARRIVMSVAGCTDPEAERGLEQSHGSVKEAVLIAAGAADSDAAGLLLDRARGRLRLALSMLKANARGVAAGELQTQPAEAGSWQGQAH